MERARVAGIMFPSGDGQTDGTGGAEDGVDPSMRVHTVMIAVSDEVPFDLFWPMVRDDILSAVRELHPRGLGLHRVQDCLSELCCQIALSNVTHIKIELFGNIHVYIYIIVLQI